MGESVHIVKKAILSYSEADLGKFQGRETSWTTSKIWSLSDLPQKIAKNWSREILKTVLKSSNKF